MNEMILNLLERNARMPDKDIAAIVGTDAKKVAETIDSLEDAGVIRGYNTLIDWNKAGQERTIAFIEVKVSLSHGMTFDKIAEQIYQYPEVTSMYLISGAFDFGVFVTGKSMREVAMFVSERLSTIDGVTNTATQFILKDYKDHGVVMAEKEPDEREAIS